MSLGCKQVCSEKGFTLLESLLSLFIFMIISTFLVMFLSTMFHHVYKQNVHPFEWENFMRQAQMELRKSTNWRAEGNVLSFTMSDGRTATYGKYQNLIRKQVGGLGHEVLLQNIASFTCVPIPNGVQFNITDTRGKSYERIITYIGNEEVIK